jgi:hypothetical protein
MKRILKFNESSGSEEMTFEIFKNIMLEVLDDFDYDYEFQIDEDGIFVCLINMNETDEYEEPMLNLKDFIENNLPDDIDREPLDQFSKNFSINIVYNRDLLYNLKKDRIEKKIKDHEYFLKFLDSLFSVCNTRISEYKGELMIGKTYGYDLNSDDFFISIFYDPND